MKFFTFSYVILLSLFTLFGQVFAAVEPFVILGGTSEYHFSPDMFEILAPHHVGTDGVISPNVLLRPHKMLQTPPVELPSSGSLKIIVKFEARYYTCISFDILAITIPLAEIKVHYRMEGKSLWHIKPLSSADVGTLKTIAEINSAELGRLIGVYGSTSGEKQLVFEPIHIENGATDVIVSVGQIWSDTLLKINEIQVGFTKDSDD